MTLQVHKFVALFHVVCFEQDLGSWVFKADLLPQARYGYVRMCTKIGPIYKNRQGTSAASSGLNAGSNVERQGTYTG